MNERAHDLESFIVDSFLYDFDDFASRKQFKSADNNLIHSIDLKVHRRNAIRIDVNSL